LEIELKKSFPGITILAAVTTRKEFQFLSRYLMNGGFNFVADFLKAWVGCHLPKYIWMDADMLVVAPANELLELLKSTSRIMMARDLPIKPKPATSLDYYMHSLGRMYLDMYRRSYDEPPVLDLDHRNMPVIMNAGVIIVNRNYASDCLWIFHRISELSGHSRRLSRYLRNFCFFQGIWNLIFWRYDGALLDSKFNRFHPRRPSMGTVAIHYAGAAKRAMLMAALRAGYA
jgi:hypothetical protein